MAITWTRELPRERSLSGKKGDGSKYQRAFLVRTDGISDTLASISNAPGIALGDTHPEDGSVECDSFDVKAADDSGLLYRVSFEYTKQKPADPENPEDPEQTDGPSFGGRIPTWSANSSVTSGPVFKDNGENIITNSAGDPLEGLEKEHAEFRLSRTEYWAQHTTWRTNATQFTNTVNDALWNGGEIGTWKCQGCSAKLNIENKDGTTDIFWEVTWEFAYRSEGWELRVWDVGFHELNEERGVPSEVDPPAGGECPGDAKRKAILGEDKKPVKHPVALSKGKAKTPCAEPDELVYEVYAKNNFMDTFGELETPAY